MKLLIIVLVSAVLVQCANANELDAFLDCGIEASIVNDAASARDRGFSPQLFYQGQLETRLHGANKKQKSWVKNLINLAYGYEYETPPSLLKARYLATCYRTHNLYRFQYRPLK